MSAVIFQSETSGLQSPLTRVRVAGGVSVRAKAAAGRSTASEVRERDGYKVRFARRADPLEAVIVNTGGGLASGDTVHQDFAVDDRASLTVTTQAPERCYRSSDGSVTNVMVEAVVGEGATLNWLPQETILFNHARLARSIDVSLSSSARLLMAETVVFGRRAMGETLSDGLFTDRWRIRRDGTLVFAENIRLTGDVFDMLTLPVMADGAHAVTTVLLASPDAERWLGRARSALDGAPFECGASAWHDKLIVRGLANKPEDIRNVMEALIPAIGGPRLPRTWLT